MKSLFTGVAALAFVGTAQAATAVADLAKPPADAQAITIMSSAGRHGVSYRWTTPDGVLHSRESMNLRGQVFEMDSVTKLGPDGLVREYTLRGFTPQGDVAETYSLEAGVGRWKSPVDAGSTPVSGPVEYVALRRVGRAERGDRRGALRGSGPRSIPAARRPRVSGEGFDAGGRVRRQPPNRRPLCHHRPLQHAVPGLAGRQGPVLRRGRGGHGRPRRLRGGRAAARQGAGRRAGRPLAGARAPARQGAGGADRLRSRAGLRGRDPLRRGSHGGRGRRQDRRGGSLLQHQSAARRAGHRRPRQDAGARPVGLAPALRRRLQRSVPALARDHLDPRPGQQQPTDAGPARPAGEGRPVDAARLSVGADRREGALHRPGRQRGDQPGRSDRPGRQGQGRGLHRHQVLRDLQPRLGRRHRRRGAQAGPARPRPHPGRDADDGRDQRRLRRDHPHLLRGHAGDARQRGQGLQRHRADAGAGQVLQGRRRERPSR